MLRSMLDHITLIVIKRLPDVQFQFQEEIALRAMDLLENTQPFRFLNYSADAIEHAVKFGYLPKDHVLSCKTLNWEQVRPCIIYR